MSVTSDAISELGIASVDALGRRFRTEEFRRRVVAEALAPEASVAEVARRNGLNANLVFKWIRRARDGWVDGRRTRASRCALRDQEPLAFVPVTMVAEAPPQLPAPIAAAEDVAAPSAPRGMKRRIAKRRGVIEIALPDGARISVDADVDETALRAVLSAMKDKR